jgi:hypothetical protein
MTAVVTETTTVGQNESVFHLSQREWKAVALPADHGGWSLAIPIRGEVTAR